MVMDYNKQTLLRQHRQRKRAILLLSVVAMAVLLALGFWWLLPIAAVVGWLLHEAFFSDHLFYSPQQDYRYQFGNASYRAELKLDNGRLTAAVPDAQQASTWLLAIRVQSTWLGRWRDPLVQLMGARSTDQQTFERSVDGIRYLNLSEFAEELAQGHLQLRGKHCQLGGSATLFGFQHADFRRQRTLIIAPHADDAELAAFGYYQNAADTHIVTVTVGELEADDYEAYGLSAADAAALKARLRVWDSQAIPQWAGVAAARCWQLGYFCLQLQPMQQEPQRAFGSRVAPLTDIRAYRGRNASRLPGDRDGAASWDNLVADLQALLETIKPDVIITPHPQLDPHSDHVACTAALDEAIQRSHWQPQTLLHYANHLHDNDRWPMGNAHDGIALAPSSRELAVESVCSLPLSPAQQLDKAMALRMMHDLQPPLAGKKRLRRRVQQWLAGRRWPAYGDSEFFRKAVRRHELFLVRTLPPRPQPTPTTGD